MSPLSSTLQWGNTTTEFSLVIQNRILEKAKILNEKFDKCIKHNDSSMKENSDSQGSLTIDLSDSQIDTELGYLKHTPKKSNDKIYVQNFIFALVV